MSRSDTDIPIRPAQLDERERKYELDDAFVPPDLTGALSADQRIEVHQPVVLQAVYFDTEDRVLLEAGIELRRRLGGTDAGWHLKVPTSDPITRHETQLPLTDVATIPDEIARLLEVRFGRIVLQPVLFMRTARGMSTVSAGEELVAGVASDDVLTVDLERWQLSGWREVEIEEEGAGSSATVERITRALIQAGARPARYLSKVARGLDAGDPSGRVPTALEPVMLRTQVAALITREADVREHRSDAIHQMRVASRRLRSCLRTFRPAFTQPSVSELLGELKWLDSTLGAARDAEVIASRVQKDVGLVASENLLGPVAAALHGRGAAEIAKADAALMDALDSDRYRSLLESLVAFTTKPPISGEKRGRKWPSRRLSKVIEKTDAAVQHAYAARSSEREAAFHEARKSAKHVRYAAETLLPIDKRLARTAKAYESIQQTLGEHHDAILIRSVFRTEGARAGVRGGQNGFAYGVLFAIEDARAAKALKRFDKEWERLTAAGRR